jgi:DNA-binding transcriptional MocR family regulator
MKSSPEWIPTLATSGGSWAERLADAIAADVATGRLAHGQRLPTHRALAQQLGVTPGTVNRGYAIAARAGVITTEVGRGTFVSAPTEVGIHDGSLTRDAPGLIELGINYPPGIEAERALQDTLPRLGRRRNALTGLLALSPYAGRPQHRAAGARWLRQFGVSASAEEVLLCTSVQHGLAAALAALTAPGDVVLTESLTSPGIKALAATRQLHLVPVAGDDDGTLPDALAAACRATNARVFYTMPTLHTPTTVTMSNDRRRAIADVLRTQNLIAIEDDAWGFLALDRVAALHSYASEHVVYVTTVSKALAPGLRVGFVVAPPALARAVTACIGALTWAPPLMVEIVAHWIEDGTAASIMKQRVRTAQARQRLAHEILGSAFASSRLPAYHLWLPLAEPWRAETFVAQAETMGVGLASTDNFVPGRTATPHAVRVCVGTEANVERVKEGLRIIARMLESGPRYDPRAMATLRGA